MLKLGYEKQALLNEFVRPLPKAAWNLATLMKTLPVRHEGLRPIEEAISTGGGVPFDAIDDSLMLKSIPGILCRRDARVGGSYRRLPYFSCISDGTVGRC